MNGEANPDFLPLRKKAYAMTEEEAWNILASPDTPYGFLGTHGVEEDGGMPYVVPMNFAADRRARAIYMHTTLDADSKRNRAVARDPNAAFTVVHPASAVEPSPDGVACRFSMKFTSVMVFGKISKVEQPAEKARILNLIVKQKGGADNALEVPEFATAVATIYALEVEHISGAVKK